jgi:excisionase family DNA binding protein
MTKREHTLTVAEAAALLDIHPHTLYRWCENGWITFIKPTPRSPRRFRREDVLALLEPIESTAS